MVTDLFSHIAPALVGPYELISLALEGIEIFSTISVVRRGVA